MRATTLAAKDWCQQCGKSASLRRTSTARPMTTTRLMVRLRACRLSQGQPVQAFELQAALCREPGLSSRVGQCFLLRGVFSGTSGQLDPRARDDAPGAVRACQQKIHEGGEKAHQNA